MKLSIELSEVWNPLTETNFWRALITDDLGYKMAIPGPFASRLKSKTHNLKMLLRVMSEEILTRLSTMSPNAPSAKGASV